MVCDFLDRYSRGDTLCHRLPARLKIVMTLSVVLTAVLLPVEFWPLHGCLAALVFAGLGIAGVPLTYLIRRVLLFAPFVIGVAIAAPISRGFASGWEIAAGIVVRALVSFLAGLWLVNVTPFDQLLAALGKLGMPHVLVEILAFMYRYLFVLFDELARMRTARRARTFGRCSRLTESFHAAQLIGMLLIRAMDRAERIHGAMCARNWSGRARSLD